MAPDEEGPDAMEPFALVGNETRAGVLRTLAERQRESPDDPSLAFSELRERVGVRDSGQFNYHLSKLEGRLVEKSEDGYGLSLAGLRAVGAMVAGAYDADREHGPAAVPGDCPFCGDGLSATFENGAFRVTCGNDHSFQQNLLPSAVEDRSMAEVASLMTLTLHQDLQLARRGVCPTCHGRMERGLDAVETDEFAGPVFRATCTRCGTYYTSLPGAPLALHPAVSAFYRDHGVDLRERPFWELALYDADCARVVDDDPLRVRVAVELDGERLDVTLDEDAEVASVERE